jgi:hypothetical protein
MLYEKKLFSSQFLKTNCDLFSWVRPLWGCSRLDEDEKRRNIFVHLIFFHIIFVHLIFSKCFFDFFSRNLTQLAALTKKCGGKFFHIFFSDGNLRNRFAKKMFRSWSKISHKSDHIALKFNAEKILCMKKILGACELVIRVARWCIYKPKIQIWVHFRGP